jgi:hypothetical protein
MCDREIQQFEFGEYGGHSAEIGIPPTAAG